MNKPSNNLRRWTSGFLSFAMLFFAAGSGLAWQCTDGTPCPAGHFGPGGRLAAPASATVATTGECTKCAVRRAFALPGNFQGMSGGKGCVLASSDRISSLTQRYSVPAPQVFVFLPQCKVSEDTVRIQYSIPADDPLPPEPATGIYAGRAPPSTC